MSYPDWVMYGVRHGDGVMVLASSELSMIELQQEWDHGLAASPFEILSAIPRTTLRVEMRRFTIATGRTYAEAVSNLMGSWNPDARPSARSGIGAGPRELGTGTREIE